MIRSLGGYLELELNRGEEYHSNCIKLNSGRAAFEYLIRAGNFSKVYLPAFTCDAMLEPLHKLKLDYEFYSIKENFTPYIELSKIETDSAFVYNNYFGINTANVNNIIGETFNEIIDNSQAFFAKPLESVDVFYSPRKFFGIPDGGYLYSNKSVGEELDIDVNSHKRFSHLIGRINEEAEKHYTEFKENDKSLTNEPIKRMSILTQRLLQNIDYEYVKRVRKENFKILDSQLSSSNKLTLLVNNTDVPLVYPYLTSNGSLIKQNLISKKIFVPTYWPNVADRCKPGSFEYELYENLVALPIDQRYGGKEMNYIIEVIHDYGK